MDGLEIKYPLSENPQLARIECAMLANRMRSCWGLWNRGHPFEEIVDHRYNQADDWGDRHTPASYAVSFAGQDEELPEFVIEHLAPLLLARFIMEMAMLYRSTLPDGQFHCVLLSSPAPRLVLRPAVPRFRGKGVSLHSRSSKSVANRGRELGDLAGLLEMGCSLLGISVRKPRKGMSPEGAAEWLHSSLGAIQLPVQETKLIAKGSEGFVCASTSEELRHWEACYYDDGSESSQIKLQSKGSASPARINHSDTSFEPRGGSPRIRVAPTHGRPDRIRPQDYEMFRLWTDCLASWNDDRNLKGVARMEAALLSEEMQILRRCYPVELVPASEAGTKTGQHAYRLLVNEPHPVFGEMKRDDGGRMVDACFDEGSTGVCINSNPEPLDFKGTTYEIMRTKDDDPNILLVKEGEITGARPPERGWLRVIDQGTASLQFRKRSLIREATRRKSVRRALGDLPADEDEVEGWLERHEEWRLDSGGAVQLVQGPPGTGKTWTATRLVEDVLRERPDSRILLCAKEHLPLDHLTRSVIEALDSDEFRGITVARVVGGRKRELGEIDKGISCDEEGHRKVSGLISSVKSLSEDDGFQERIGEIESSMSQQGHKAPWPGEFNAREASVVCVTSTDSEMLRLVGDSRLGSFDYAIVEEAGKSFPSELLSAISMSRNTILIGDQMQLPPYEIKSIRDNLGKILSLDREKIPPDYNKRLNRLLSKVHFTHYGASPEERLSDITPWLEPFKTLYYHSEDDLSGQSSTMLVEERRMFEELSDIVGEVFYSGPFVWMKEGGIDEGGLPGPFDRLGRLILVDTPHCSRDHGWREERAKSGSWCNKMEAAEVVKAARAIASSGNEVVVLSPYLGQVGLIKRKLGKAGAKVGVYTVDGYQGKEADFILLSLVRNNDKTAWGRWGFVSDPNRLNVALSRAREGLVVFASMEHLAGSEFDDGMGHLKVALDMIAETSGTSTLGDLRGALQ